VIYPIKLLKNLHHVLKATGIEKVRKIELKEAVETFKHLNRSLFARFGTQYNLLVLQANN